MLKKVPKAIVNRKYKRNKVVMTLMQKS